ncbi:RNA methyltransferase, TrmH family [Kytococcus aerolatus]|uniref:RNA methyltransferase, TrmH family n=1 Tax=Kytococcus aerolatus TaxID=592308 RepID=A0A212U338_9MICO|nr:RNA methyltransferase, TrmH family [Kytococcus aerolatus]
MQPTPSPLTPTSSRVRAAAGLGRRSARRRSGHYLVEGPQCVRELLVWEPERAQDVFLTAEFLAGAPEFGDLLAGTPVHAHLVADEVVRTVADAQTPAGIVAVARWQPPPLVEALGRVGEKGFGVVLSEVRDPGNLGTVIRAADAAGAACVVVTDSSVDVTNPKVVRSTAGSLHHLPVATGVPFAELLAAARAAEHPQRLLAADGYADTLLPAAELAGPHLWVMGNEARGLDPVERDACDLRVAVPLYGRAESLNLGTAAAVCLYASAMDPGRR